MDFYKWIDDFLIDEVCQPICDWLRDVFGLTKRIPISVSLTAVIIGSIPGVIFFLYSGRLFSVVLGCIGVIWIAVLSTHLYDNILQ